MWRKAKARGSGAYSTALQASKTREGCYTPRDLMLSVVEMSVEFVLSTCSNSLSLVRMALYGVSNATEKDRNVRVKIVSETLMGLYWMLSGL